MAAHRAVGAVVAALLSAVTEPVVNNMLVERLSLMEAVKTLDPMKITKFLQITLARNFMNILKNNIFASIRKQNFHLPTARLAVGSIFFVTLPVTASES